MMRRVSDCRKRWPCRQDTPGGCPNESQSFSRAGSVDRCARRSPRPSTAPLKSCEVSVNSSSLDGLRCKMATNPCSESCPCETWDRKVAVDELSCPNSRCSRSVPGLLLSSQWSRYKFGTGHDERAIAVQTSRSFSIGIRLRSANFTRRLAGGVPPEFHRHHD